MRRRTSEPEPKPEPQPQQNNLLVVALAIGVAFFAGKSGGCSPVVPPGPVPPNPPPIVVPDVTPTQGKRCVVVLHESQSQSPAFARLRIALQSGDSRKYIRDKGHQLYFVDEQQKGPDGKILDVVEHLKSSLAGKKTPAVLVCEDVNGKCGKVLYVEQITDSTTADNVIEYIRRGGG